MLLSSHLLLSHLMPSEPMDPVVLSKSLRTSIDVHISEMPPADSEYAVFEDWGIAYVKYMVRRLVVTSFPLVLTISLETIEDSRYPGFRKLRLW